MCGRSTKTPSPLIGRLAFVIVLLSGCGTYRVRSVWEVPQGYRGWVLVERANPRCQPAQFTLTSVVFRVDSSGHGCTSTPLAKASQLLSFWEIDSLGRKHELPSSPGGLIWGFSNAAASNEFVSIREATEFFVGTEAEFDAAQQSRPKWWLQGGAKSTRSTNRRSARDFWQGVNVYISLATFGNN